MIKASNKIIKIKNEYIYLKKKVNLKCNKHWICIYSYITADYFFSICTFINV